jgi:hypothetical protein
VAQSEVTSIVAALKPSRLYKCIFKMVRFSEIASIIFGLSENACVETSLYCATSISSPSRYSSIPSSSSDHSLQTKKEGRESLGYLTKIARGRF